MKLPPYRTRVSKLTGISFPLRECWNPMTKVATLAAEVSGRRVLCRISRGVLQQRFCASVLAPMQAIVENRLLIETTARRLIENGEYEADGSILIQAEDIAPA